MDMEIAVDEEVEIEHAATSLAPAVSCTVTRNCSVNESGCRWSGQH